MLLVFETLNSHYPTLFGVSGRDNLINTWKWYLAFSISSRKIVINQRMTWVTLFLDKLILGLDFAACWIHGVGDLWDTTYIYIYKDISEANQPLEVETDTSSVEMNSCFFWEVGSWRHGLKQFIPKRWFLTVCCGIETVYLIQWFT